ncbi:zinc finger MYM-type 2 isoform X2 [Pelobates cultripes]|uniref:Zinc finger MYM-type 2 isoform X2 n=1 Tax=Pelobates cultripes TaxID=61616 RepID=A0AAD1VRR9_PELCU|nr:zinc finger MYM-type 2 isoform X2 [Pelobates cultripes]
MDIGTVGRLDHIHTNSQFRHKTMATGLTNVGNAFGGQTSSAFQSTPIDDDDDDVVFVEPVQVTQSTPHTDQRRVGFPKPRKEQRADPKLHSSSKELDSLKGTISETIIIDDEEDPEPCHVQEKNASSFGDRLLDTNRPISVDFPSSSSFSRSKANSGIISTGITTEPDSEIQIANVTTLESGINSVNDSHLQNTEGRDMNLMITHVTSLQNPGLGEVQNGLHSNNFGVHVQTYPPTLASQTKPAMGPYNPGRIVSGDVFQNGESATHPNPDSWISQSASFPRNQKQPGVDSSSPVASLPKQVLQSPSQQPQPPPPKAVKVTCANCKKPLQKGQTAYQRKGSTHLFCSTTCLSSFSHKPAPKKLCTMCKKDITTMKGTIVAQVDSSESFQEFCSTYCLSVYEDKQNSSKNQSKSRCTICGKLTEIRHEVSFKNMTHKLCSDHCFNRYRMANGLIMNCCEQCGEYLPSKGAGNNVLMVEGQWKRFCSPACLNDFKLKHGKLTSCTGCKAQCRCFDMTQCIGTNGHMEPYCSTTCMNNHKAKYAKPPTQNAGIICHFCKKNSLPQYQATMPDGKLYNFCSSGCVAKFQTLSMQSTTNGQHASSDIQLKCNYCKNVFSSKPETLEWENKVNQFCSTTCCEDYKKLHCIVTYCEYCQEEKTLHEVIKFSGVKKPFCSEGCKLLYKQDFARRLGLKCVTCNYCFQMCKRGATKEYDGMVRDFCSEDCSKKFQEWYYKAARCDCCKTQGTLREKVQWRGTIKNFCDQQCLLRFYSQQNEPNMSTQKGPENMHYADQGVHTTRTRSLGAGPSSAPAMSKDMKNKAVLCKPLSMTKATYCKPHMQGKICQTDNTMAVTSSMEELNTKYVPVPIPVPVYLPAPMQLYSQNIPTPTAVPIPVPIPIFLPDSLLRKVQNGKLPEEFTGIAELVAKSTLCAEESMETLPLATEETLEKDQSAPEEILEENSLPSEDMLAEDSLPSEDMLAEDSLPSEDVLAGDPLPSEDVLAENPLPSEDVLAENPLPSEDVLAENPLPSMDVLAESPLPSEDVLAENPLPSEDVLAENPLPSEDVLAENPLPSEDVLAENPLPSEDVLAENPLPSEDVLAENPLPSEDVLAENPLPSEDVLAENPLPSEDVLAENPLPSEDVLAENPLPSEDVLAENPLPSEDVLAENPLPSEDVLAENPLPSEDVLAENPLPSEDVLAENPFPSEDVLEENPFPSEDVLAENPLPSEDVLEENPFPSVDVLEENPLPSEDVLEENPLPSEDVLKIPLSPEEILDKSPLPIDLAHEESPFHTVVVLEKSPLPRDEIMEKSPLPSEHILVEGLLSTDEMLEKSPIPTEEFLEKSDLDEESVKSPLALSDIDELTVIEVDPEDKDICENITIEAVSQILDVVPFKSCLTEEQLVLPDVPYDPELDIEVDFPRAAEELDTENEFLLPPVFGEEYEDQPRPRPFKKGAKRKALLDCQSLDDSPENTDSVFPFKYSYGLNAWKHWARTHASNSDEMLELEEPSCTKSVKLKDLLQHTPRELSCLLACFVNEVRRPNGEIYAPDSIYYMCLGIQEFLSCWRKDNIFVDSDYQEFGQEFSKILRSWQPSILPDGSIFSRVEEDYMWQVNQLGTQSPMSLIFTLFYFNTKYFNLKTVEQHLRLSFGSVLRHLKNNPLTKENKACLQYQVSSLCENDSTDKIASCKRKHEDDEPVFEQIENTADPSRCPVKIFEYYLSKSPQNLKQRMDLFYLKPESSASTESLVWYTSSSLDRNTMENMLIRVLLIKDIYEKNCYELDEDTD